MKKLLIKHADKLAIGVSVLLAGIVIVIYIVSIDTLSNYVETALNPNSASTELPEFDLETAQKLDLKGLEPGR